MVPQSTVLDRKADVRGPGQPFLDSLVAQDLGAGHNRLGGEQRVPGLAGSVTCGLDDPLIVPVTGEHIDGADTQAIEELAVEVRS